MLSQRSFRGALPEEERETLKQTPTQPRFPGEETTRYLSEQIKASRSRRLCVWGGGITSVHTASMPLLLSAWESLHHSVPLWFG